MQHDVFADHLADMTLFRKRIQLRLERIIFVGLIERLFEILIAVGGVILRANSFGVDNV